MSQPVYGRNAVLELLRSKPEEVEKIYFQFNTDNNKLKEIMITAKRHKISIGKARNHKLIELAKTDKHQGVCALVSPTRYYDLDDLLEKKRGKRHLFVLLDGLEDPHNVGAIIRTAEAAGSDAVVVVRNQGAPINAVVSKSSAGTVSKMKICKVANLSQTIDTLKKHNIWVYGLDMHGQKPYYDVDFTDDVAIVIGSEGKGLRDLVSKHCDDILNIPIVGKVESLNASVSAAVVLYEIIRQRLKG